MTWFTHPPRTGLALLLTLAFTACGGDGGTGPSGGEGAEMVASVTVTPASTDVTVGGTVALAATAADTQGRPVSATFTWDSRDEMVATVSGSGLVTGVGVGSTTVTATAKSVRGTAAVTVLASPPAAPSDLSALATSQTEIALTWTDNSSDETGFEVERSLAPDDGFATVATVGSDLTAHTDAGLDPATTYHYRVRALGDGVASDYSAVAMATTPEDPAAVVTSVEAAIIEVIPPPGTSVGERNLFDEVDAVAARLATLPGVDTVFVLDRALAVEALLEDGSTYLFINNRPAGVEAEAAALAGRPGGSPGNLSGSAPQGVDGPPSSARAVVTSYDGGAAVAGEVAQMVGDAGYQVLPLGTSLADMRQYKNLGILHLDTHGVPFIRARRNPDGSINKEGRAFGLQTFTTVAGSDLTSLSEELRSGKLVYSLAEDADGHVETKLAITELFIADNWSFDDGVVMLHACYGGAGPFQSSETNDQIVDPTALRIAMLGAGARIVVAYDNLTWTSYARPTILHFFDRLLGADSFNPETPPLRPFDDLSVLGDMQERGLLQFQRPSTVFLGMAFGGNEVNVVFDRTGGRTTLAPSIRSIDVVDDAALDEGMMTLHGIFGGDPGTVEVDGTEIPLETWSDDHVTARVPFEGPGSSGDVVAMKPDHVKSNEVPLTEWRGDVTFSFEPGDGSLKLEAEIDTRFRADVHAFREQLDESPKQRAVTAYISPGSSGHSTGTGSYVDGNTTLSYEGDEEIEILPRARVEGSFILPAGSSVFGGRATLDPEAGTARICMAIVGYATMHLHSSGGDFEYHVPLLLTFFELFTSADGSLACLDLPLQEGTYTIPAGQHEVSEDGAVYRLKWGTFQPMSLPTGDTAG